MEQIRMLMTVLCEHARLRCKKYNELAKALESNGLSFNLHGKLCNDGLLAKAFLEAAREGLQIPSALVEKIRETGFSITEQKPGVVGRQRIELSTFIPFDSLSPRLKRQAEKVWRKDIEITGARLFKNSLACRQ